MRLALDLLIAFNSLAVARASSISQPASDCSSLLNLTLAPGYEVSNAAIFQSETLNASGIVNTVALCRVEGTIHYGHDLAPGDDGPNTLTWNLYLPKPNDYNGRFIAVGKDHPTISMDSSPLRPKAVSLLDIPLGNGGYAGEIDEASMMTQLNLGYAVAGCDSGHSIAATGNSTSAPFLKNNAEVKAWIHDSIAMTTNLTRDLTTEFYTETPAFSYYYGCSTGGAQGYALAQLYPEMFDGIFAGSPGNWYSHLILSFLWNGLHTQRSGYMSQEVLDFITTKVVSACDHLDGAIDGLIENPQLCKYNITQLECASGQNSTTSDGAVECLTSDQISATKAIYDGPKSTIDGEEIYPGMSLGSESSWLLQETTLYTTYSALILKELVFDRSSYNVSKFDWGEDVLEVDQIASPLIDAISSDLSAFHSRGGKLITTQGWADPFNAALWPIQHRNQIQANMSGINASDFMEIFMVPGGGHCGSNPAYPHVPGTYDVLDALALWVEQGVYPAEIKSSDPPDGTNTTRKLCPWPKNARYVAGDVDDWVSYDCA
ncbi:unnamed protein product [Penicillium olsonii]|uniref:Carboxylic ester hydrolase n=1 Tax=Penicillium olsonii TaxID=99116 RepID=A0A9W4HMI8_PENOL|nr:unnamed protein product [Penicillium olsonii]